MRHVAPWLVLGLAAGPAWALDRGDREVSLDGAWELASAPDLEAPPADGWEAWTVPGTVRGATGGAVWVRRTVRVPEGWPGAVLRLAGAKFECRVLVDGAEVGRRRFGGYVPWLVDPGDALVPGREHELSVGCRDWTSAFSEPVELDPGSRGELRAQVHDVLLDPIGGHYDHFGLWDEVSLIAAGPVLVEGVRIIPSVREGTVAVGLSLRNRTGAETDAPLAYEVLDADGAPVGLQGSTPARRIPAGTTEVSLVTFDAFPWRLWSPEDPYLYRLVLRVGDDAVTRRFGVRELWTDGPRFVLNGVPLRLRAASSWPSPAPLDDATVRRTVADLLAGNNNTMRFHTQPWRDAWYEAADELGLLVVEEAPLWCDHSGGYRYGDPVFWDNYRATLAGMVDRHGHHPSLVIWSLENELLHCGGSRFDPELERKLGDLGRFMKQLDPSRPITFESDLDPDGAADVVGLHYAHEFPRFFAWPREAWWLDQDSDHPWRDGETWRWDRAKPLYIGEFMWLPLADPRPLGVFLGDAAWRDLRAARNRTKALLWSLQLPALRAQGVSALCPWTLFEDPASQGPADLRPADNRLYQTVREAYEPVMAWDEEPACRLFSGEEVVRRIWVFNDGPGPLSPARLEVALDGRETGQDLDQEPATSRRYEVTVQAPEVEEDAVVPLVLSVVADGERLFSRERPCAVWPRPAPAAASASVLVVAEDTVAPGLPEVGPGPGGVVGPALELVRDGGTLLVLAQSSPSAALPVRTVSREATVVHPRLPDHPVLRGLTGDDLRFWRGDGLVLRRPLVKPGSGVYRVVADLADDQGLRLAAVLEVPLGLGRLLVSQVPLVGEAATEPAAARLLANLTGHAAGAPYEQPALLGVSGDGPLAGWLTRNRVPFLDLDGQEAAWECPDVVAAPALDTDRLRALTARGATVLLKRPDVATLAALAEVAGPLGLTLRERPVFPLFRVPGHPETRGVSDEDLHWLGPRSTDWRHPTPLAGGLCDAHLVPELHPDDIVASVTGADLEHAGPIHPQGEALVFYGNGSASTTVTLPADGTWLLGVEAWGTPLDAQFPLAVLRLDGEPIGSHVVSAEPVRYVTAAPDVAAGAHRLEVAFTNDAHRPPEDRNLTVERLLWARQEAPPRARALLDPVCLARVEAGAGRVILDWTSWDADTTHPEQSARLGAALLANLGVQSRPASVVRLEAEALELVDVVYTHEHAGVVWLGDSGALRGRLRFLADGPYAFTVRALGTPLGGDFPRPALRLDGREVARFTVDAEPREQVLRAEVAAGERTVEVVFDDDAWDPDAGEDRNLAVDWLEVRAELPGRPPLAVLRGPERLLVGEPGTWSARCSFGEAPLEYRIDPGDGADWSVEPELRRSWETPGRRLIRLWVRDAHGRVSVDGLQVLVVAPGEDAGDAGTPDAGDVGDAGPPDAGGGADADADALPPGPDVGDAGRAADAVPGHADSATPPEPHRVANDSCGCRLGRPVAWHHLLGSLVRR